MGCERTTARSIRHGGQPALRWAVSGQLLGRGSTIIRTDGFHNMANFDSIPNAISFIALASYVCPSTACLIPSFEVAVILMLLLIPVLYLGTCDQSFLIILRRRVATYPHPRPGRCCLPFILTNLPFVSCRAITPAYNRLRMDDYPWTLFHDDYAWATAYTPSTWDPRSWSSTRHQHSKRYVVLKITAIFTFTFPS